jgi:hypothetical protein
LQKEAYKAWFSGLIFSAIAGLYTLWQLGQREQRLDKNEGEGVVESKKIQRYVYPRLKARIRSDLRWQRAGCDEPTAHFGPL